MRGRRFIAGARCPGCGALDTLQVFEEEGKPMRACVDCDFSEEMRFSSAPVELTTRVNKTEEDVSKETQVVTILTPGRKK